MYTYLHMFVDIYSCTFTCYCVPHTNTFTAWASSNRIISFEWLSARAHAHTYTLTCQIKDAQRAVRSLVAEEIERAKFNTNVLIAFAWHFLFLYFMFPSFFSCSSSFGSRWNQILHRTCAFLNFISVWSQPSLSVRHKIIICNMHHRFFYVFFGSDDVRSTPINVQFNNHVTWRNYNDIGIEMQEHRYKALVAGWGRCWFCLRISFVSMTDEVSLWHFKIGLVG